MGKDVITFDDIEIEKKQKFHYHKSPISIYNIDINKIVVSSKVHFGGFKYFIGYKNDKKIRPLCLMLPKKKLQQKYKRNFDETKYMTFSVKDDKLLEEYNEIWGKVSNSMKKGFHSEAVC